MEQSSTGRHEAYKALDMLNALTSVGVRRFDVTFTDLDGKKLDKGGYLPNRHINGIRSVVGHILRRATSRGHNLIIRPRVSDRAELIQLDDLTREQAGKFEHRASRSPGFWEDQIGLARIDTL